TAVRPRECLLLSLEMSPWCYLPVLTTVTAAKNGIKGLKKARKCLQNKSFCLEKNPFASKRILLPRKESFCPEKNLFASKRILLPQNELVLPRNQFILPRNEFVLP
ncbi:MAG: hypothetical protein KJ052_18225, partial [Candidatus Hydrogenedentes bacterium]|nr:hypothetical protein [Candidatus Hydrogenedentota bacterium]